MACLLLASTVQALQVGQKAPDFTLPAPNGKQVRLDYLLGKGQVGIFTFIQASVGSERRKFLASMRPCRSSKPITPRSWA
jgi:hypothetical protein